MLDTNHRARITNFGLVRDHSATEETYPTTGGAARWTAPEILGGEGSSSKEADIFSFAMIMVEVGSRKSLAIDLQLIAFPFGGGLHWLHSVRPASIYPGCISHNKGGTPFTARSPRSHGPVVGADGKLLESRTPLASGCVRSVASFAQAVSTPFIP